MARRRASGEGSIFKRSDGLWVARITVNRERIQKTSKRQGDVRTWLHEKRAQITEGLQLTAGRTRLADYLAYWLDIHSSNLRPKTIAMYDCTIRDHINPALGNIPMERLRPDHIQRLYADKQDADASYYVIRQIHATLHAALEKAVRWNIMPRNVADAVDRPQPPHHEKQTLSPGQIRRLLATASGHRSEALIHLALATGARLGELLGLFWNDVDFDASTITVRRQLQRLPRGGGLVFSEPKTAQSNRRIAIDAGTMAVLVQHRQAVEARRLLAGERWQEYDLVFPSRKGTPLEPRRALSELHQMLAKAGLPQMPFHALRHTSATLLITAGEDVKTVSQRLGHSTVNITLDTYTHPDAGGHVQAANTIGRILSEG